MPRLFRTTIRVLLAIGICGWAIYFAASLIELWWNPTYLAVIGGLGLVILMPMLLAGCGLWAWGEGHHYFDDAPLFDDISSQESASNRRWWGAWLLFYVLYFWVADQWLNTALVERLTPLLFMIPPLTFWIVHRCRRRYARYVRGAISRLDHVQLAIPSGGEVAARAFYAGVLGFEELPKPPELAGRGGAWFRCGEIALHVGVDAAFVPARKAHPAFRCADYDRFLDGLTERGIAIAPDALLFEGKRHCYIADPFGNRIELIEA